MTKRTYVTVRAGRQRRTRVMCQRDDFGQPQVPVEICSCPRHGTAALIAKLLNDHEEHVANGGDATAGDQ